jgi:mannose-1-phosphate guanylyltransferase
MLAMLLAAGRSTRLGALGQSLPKPLVPVCGYPAISFGLAACARAGLRDVVVNLHHHGDLIRGAIGDGATFGVRVHYSIEADLLGTGGGIAHARALLGDGPVVVMNAKVVADIELGDVIAAHQASGADATLVLRDDDDARSWGAIAADQRGHVVGILDANAPRAPEGAVVERMFTGIQIVGRAILDLLHPVFCDSVRDGYMPALRAGADIRAVVLPGYFAEHSTPARYLAGNLALLRRPQLVAHGPGPFVGVDHTARIDPSATLVPPIRISAGAIVEAGATVGPDVVVGPGARVAAGARISRAVLWQGTTAVGVLSDAVLTTLGPVPVPGPVSGPG